MLCYAQLKHFKGFVPSGGFGRSMLFQEICNNFIFIFQTGSWFQHITGNTLAWFPGLWHDNKNTVYSSNYKQLAFLDWQFFNINQKDICPRIGLRQFTLCDIGYSHLILHHSNYKCNAVYWLKSKLKCSDFNRWQQNLYNHLYKWAQFSYNAGWPFSNWFL